MVQSFNRENQSAGGIVIFVESCLDVNVMQISSIQDLAKESVFEMAAVKLKINSHCLNIIGIYRAPYEKNVTEFFEKLQALLLSVKGTDSFILGDFNLNILKISRNSKELLDLTSSCKFKELIKDVTRESSKTCIDKLIIP